MSKSVVQLNPKAKQQKEKNITIFKILIAIQFILTIVLIIFGIITIIKTNLLSIFELLLGFTLLVMGLNNQLIYKRKNLTIFYFIIGLASLIIAVLNLIGL